MCFCFKYVCKPCCRERQDISSNEKGLKPVNSASNCVLLLFVSLYCSYVFLSYDVYSGWSVCLECSTLLVYISGHVKYFKKWYFQHIYFALGSKRIALKNSQQFSFYEILPLFDGSSLW